MNLTQLAPSTLLLAAILAGLAILLVAILAVLLRRGAGNTANPAAAEQLAAQQAALQQAAAADARLTQLAGQIQQLASAQAAMQAATQTGLAERLQLQERALTTALDERLSALSHRVSDRLQESTTITAQTLTDLRERLAAIDVAQKNITDLSSQVVDLQNVLSNKQARGAFGEIQLQDIVQSALPAAHYEFQAALGDGKRVDCLLKLPNPPGSIAVDAKFPLEAFRALRDARDDAAQVVARRDFSTAIRTHMRAIAEKYIVPGETAESALMFLPSEAVYAELHANFPSLVEEAARLRVWIVSPTTLMATLTTIRAVLKDVRMREQAHVLQAKIGEMVKDVERLDDRVAKLQRHFEQGAEDVRQIRISTEKITRRGGEITELELGEAPNGAANLPAALGTEPQVLTGT
ncbi:DNA recombination protein RmuC [Dongia soli]|uniref:DNA recombination protein RmuC homolog n=1 Tax=Dongia soli TaxID=600628 RepID=A0ABU5E724_9PROT|nr:DNA recombination protein RmuC [Dongia soli]MDY0881677.1 DNA recombination protein RmuC [Dongia soli]